MGRTTTFILFLLLLIFIVSATEYVRECFCGDSKLLRLVRDVFPGVRHDFWPANQRADSSTHFFPIDPVLLGRGGGSVEAERIDQRSSFHRHKFTRQAASPPNFRRSFLGCIEAEFRDKSRFSAFFRDLKDRPQSAPLRRRRFS